MAPGSRAALRTGGVGSPCAAGAESFHGIAQIAKPPPPPPPFTSPPAAAVYFCGKFFLVSWRCGTDLEITRPPWKRERAWTQDSGKKE